MRSNPNRFGHSAHGSYRLCSCWQGRQAMKSSEVPSVRGQAGRRTRVIMLWEARVIMLWEARATVSRRRSIGKTVDTSTPI